MAFCVCVFATTVSSNSATGKDEDTELCEDVIEENFKQALGGSVSAPSGWQEMEPDRERMERQTDQLRIMSPFR